jgi:cytochrome c biogenesis protein CcmG/thiol:disulfide interchange protein DsbE
MKSLLAALLTVAVPVTVALSQKPLRAAGLPGAAVVGRPAPAFDLETVRGGRVSLASLRGKTVVVNVWATWCPPCQQETPDLIAAYKRLAGPGVVFVGVDSTERAALVEAFALAKDIRWTEAIDPDHKFVRAYGVRYFPTTYVIDPHGILRMTYVDVVTPKLLAGFVADAKAGRNARLASPLQAKIDALLAPGKYSFAGGPAHVVASVERVRAAIRRADEMTDDSNPAAGNPADLPRTQAEENALRIRAIAALRPIATTASRKVALDLLEGDADAYAGRYADALAAYRAAASLEPKNVDALNGISRSALRLKDYRSMLAADAALVAIDPENVPDLVGSGVDAGIAGEFARARRIFDRAVAVASKKADAFEATPLDIRLLAWAHLYYGRMEAKAGDAAAAKRQFALATQTALRLPKSDARYTIYLEQAQEETVALDLAGRRNAIGISLAPWTGPDLPASSPDTAKYRLVVTGAPGRSVGLRAADLPTGWIASFCLGRVCAPLRTSLVLPSWGAQVIEFQVVPPEPKLLAHLPSVRVVASDGKSTTSAGTPALR